MHQTAMCELSSKETDDFRIIKAYEQNSYKKMGASSSCLKSRNSVDRLTVDCYMQQTAMCELSNKETDDFRIVKTYEQN